MTAPGRPVSVLIAALGGEGGGVLTNWIVAAAERFGFPVQSTSIPGVAQRTGATTYYIEILPAPVRELGDARPVLALAPGVGDVDVLVASELMEAGRALAAGFVTPDRTLTIASTSRFFVMDEKTAMGDGRYDSPRLMKAIEQHSLRHVLFDMEEAARRTGAFINAVMLGAIAGAGHLPMPAEAFESAIRADGKGVEANLRGFRAGLDAARAASGENRDPQTRTRGAMASLADLEREIVSAMAVAARDVIQEGARRLAVYQNIAYAQLYIDRLAPIHLADERAGANGRLLRETARHLALRMSYEDVIRVAQAKIDPARFTRIANEMGAKPDEPLHITEFLKPGIEEFCSILPPRLAQRMLALAQRRGWQFHWAMEVNTASISGYLRFWALARLKGWRPSTYRFQEEQRTIEAWLADVVEAAKSSADLALEVAQCARLIKGYGDTLKRGSANYRLIEAQVIRPALAGHLAPRLAIDAIASARTAALTDPDGESLAKCLAEIEQQSSRRIAAE